jgi:branched-chain amino acid transport system substrate-binding protein
MKGGVDGYRIHFIEVETGYETPRIVEAYERIKGMGIVFGFIPCSTGGVYAVTPKAFKDKIPLLHPGWGISAAASGKAFPWNFLAYATYWSAAAAIVKYIAEQEGGEAILKGKKVALVYLDIDYGRETIPVYERLSKEFGYEFVKYPIPWPGLEQAAVWTDIGLKTKPDWVITRLWGASSSVALREAARVGYPMSKILNPHPSMTETDIWAFDPQKSIGVKRATAILAGTDYPIIQEILRELYDKGKGAGPREQVGIYLYNLFVYTSGLGVAALKKAADKFGHPLTPEQIKWGYDHITYEDLKYAGIAELAPPRLKISPEDHEGGGWVCLVEWDGTKWVTITDWMVAYRDIVKELVEEAAEKFMKEHPELYK